MTPAEIRAMTPAETVKKIADIAEAVGFQAGVGACEIAGQLISYLSVYPDMIEVLFRDGILELPADFHAHGHLTFYTMEGKIGTPRDARIARTVRRLSKPIEDH